MRVGLIGLGAIGRGVLELLSSSDDIRVVGSLVAQPNKPRPGPPVRLCRRIEDLLEMRPDVVVEAAGHAALACYGPLVLRAGIDLVVVSVGALAEHDTEQRLVEAARAGGGHLIVASGAIGALDALGAAAIGDLQRVTHTTRKPARALLPADDAAGLAEPRTLFSGTAREAALRFPESVNVTAAVSLAGIGLDRTEVCVIADPALERNTHEVVAEGSFGQMRFQIANVPTEDNPRTGRLVAMSIVHTLRRRASWLVIG